MADTKYGVSIFQFTMSGNRNEYQFKTLPRQFCRCGRTRHMGRESALKKSSTQFQKNPFGGLRCLIILFNENKNRQAIRRDSTQVEYLFPRGKRRIAHILQISLISHISEISQIPLIFGQNYETQTPSPIRGYGLIYVGLFTLFQELGLLVLIYFLFGLFVFFY